jgi:AraC-like DNA-binding protein
MPTSAFTHDLLSTQIDQGAYYVPDQRAPRKTVQILCAGREICRRDYNVARRGFPFLAVELVVQGEGTFVTKKETTRLMVGTLICYGPGTSYRMTTEPARPMVKYFVDFAGTEATRLLAQVAFRPGQIRHALHPQRLQEILDRLIEEGNHPSRFSGEIAHSYLRVFLQKLAESVEYRTARGESKALDFYLEAKAFLEKNFESLGSAEAAAARLRVRPETLCRAFQRHASTTPYQFLLRLKINRAVDLLLGTDLQAKEIGYRLGFTDPFHFSRVFKRLQGIAPDHFRNLRSSARPRP